MVNLFREVADASRRRLMTFETVAAAPPGGIRVFDLPAGDEGCLALVDQIEREEDEAPGIVLVDRDTLSRHRIRLLMLPAAVVLKPLSRARLEIALEQAIGSSMQRLDDALVRQSRDELFRHLLEANVRLQEHDQDRTNFLARSVHELRSPLTSLNGYCDLLLERRLGPLSAQQDTVIGRMRHSLTRLSKIVTAMFQLSAGEKEAEVPKLEAGNFAGCVEQAIHEVSPLFEERQIDLAVNLMPPAGKVEFDPRQIEQVVINVLDNSCKFTPRGGAVKVLGYPYSWTRNGNNGNGKGDVKSEHAPNSYRLDILDNGPGIAPERASRIFEEHAAFGDGGDRSGSGLGLAICRMIVSRHRGSIWAESSGLGTTFSIVLPAL